MSLFDQVMWMVAAGLLGLAFGEAVRHPRQPASWGWLGVWLMVGYLQVVRP